MLFSRTLVAAKPLLSPKISPNSKLPVFAFSHRLRIAVYTQRRNMADYTYLKTRLDQHPSGTAVTGTAGSTPDVPAIVKDVIDTIRKDGDLAVRKYSEKFDKWSPKSFRLSKSEVEAAIAACPKQTIEDIKEVQKNVRAFAEAQRKSLTDFEIEIRPGIHLGQKNIPINAVGW